MSCGELGPIEGGLIKDSTIQNGVVTGSEFVGGAVRSSELVSCLLKSLASCDAASARVIAAAIAADPVASQSISQTISVEGSVQFAQPDSAFAGTALPTDVYGAREALLGEPAAWLEIGGFVVPAFRKA